MFYSMSYTTTVPRLVDGPSVKWFRSYLTERTQVFCVDDKQSAILPVTCTVPPRFRTGVQFISYSEGITAALDKHGFKRHHLFADDKQLLTSVTVTDVSVAKSNTEACVADVQAWCASRRLQLNLSKTEFIWLGTRYHLQQLAGAVLNFTIGADIIKPSTVVRDLGVLIDAKLTLQQHVSKLTSCCFFQLRRL